MGPDPSNLARYVSAAVLIAASAAALFLAITGLIEERATLAIDDADADESALARTCIADPNCKGPTRLLKLAEAMATGDKSERELARKLTERALNHDDLNPGGWALISYLETTEAGTFSEAATAAMRKSLEICRLCDNRELLRWRLSYILQTWKNVPEDIREGVFEGADLLSWRYGDDQFLQEQKAFANQYGIPFADYLIQSRASIRRDVARGK